MDVINKLPEEMLLQIFSFYIESQGYQKFVNNISPVCKKWNDLHSTGSLWTDVNSSDQCLTFKQLQNLGERGFLAHARCLKLECKVYIADESKIINLIRYYRDLTQVKISNCFLSRVTLQILAEKCPNIESLELRVFETMIPEGMNSLLSRGRKLKRLNLTLANGVIYNDLVSTIASYCHSLEELKLFSTKECGSSVRNILSVDELVVGCPKLQILDLQGCDVISSGSRVHNGFENMMSLRVASVDFGGIDLYSILKSSKDLEVLHIENCENVILNNISSIPSDKVKSFKLISTMTSGHSCSTFLEEAVGKWKQSLTTLCILGIRKSLTGVLKAYLNQNPNPKLEVLNFKGSDDVELHVLMEVIKASINLRSVFVNIDMFRSITLEDRTSIKMFPRKWSDS